MALATDSILTLFKLYKRRDRPPDVRAVLNVRDAASGCPQVFSVHLNSSAVSKEKAQALGLQPISQWKAFGLLGFPGLLLIVNPFTSHAQRYWVCQALKNYPCKPNVCNVDAHEPERGDPWQDGLRTGKDDAHRPRSLLERLRWVTLGFHYNWDSKKYTAQHWSPFPTDLGKLSSCLLRICGFPMFLPEAAIINYYRLDSTLGIHTDSSELDLTQPLLSLSFGQSAIFLLGGTQRDDPAVPLWLHSGDVMVMFGDARQRFHAVPRIVAAAGGGLPSSLLDCDNCKTMDSCTFQHVATDTSGLSISAEEWDICSRYLLKNRINVTVRQVLGPGFSFPDEPIATADSFCKNLGMDGSCHPDVML
uniref:nucleic acid dioxygenase ALKBH1 isoform X1 n=1 Tax=Myxine glutinosa TaxID=7769 RepID=UPI00358E40A1